MINNVMTQTSAESADTGIVILMKAIQTTNDVHHVNDH